MKKITNLTIALCCCFLVNAQTITLNFNNQNIDIEGELKNSVETVDVNKKVDGKKDTYINYTDFKILTATHVYFDKYNKVNRIEQYMVNINQLDDSKTFIINKTNTSYANENFYVLVIALKEPYKTMYKVQSWGNAQWEKGYEPVAQIYFSNKTDAENLLALITK